MSDDLIKRSDAIKAVWGEDTNPSEDGVVFEAQSHIDRDIRLIPSADRPRGKVNAVKVYEQASHDLEFGYITLGEFEERIESLKHLYYDRPKGEWKHDGSVWTYRFNCTNCGYHLLGKQTNYCPNCGARMKGADDGNK